MSRESLSEVKARFELERAAYLQRIAELENAYLRRIAELEKERDNLRQSHERLRQELELYKRRIFVAKAERIDTTQLEFE